MFIAECSSSRRSLHATQHKGQGPSGTASTAAMPGIRGKKVGHYRAAVRYMAALLRVALTSFADSPRSKDPFTVCCLTAVLSAAAGGA